MIADNILRLPQPDWLHHRLDAEGPSADLQSFRRAAAGAGVVPWCIDHDRLEEDWYHLLLAAPPARRGISATGARILARQLRDAAWIRHAEALDQIGLSTACPLDLHALLPVPPDILCLGPDDPRSLAWMWENWGTTWAPRRVAEVPPARTLLDAEAGFSCRFWSADWTPWRAIQRLRAGWPTLRFRLVLEYAEWSDPNGHFSQFGSDRKIRRAQ